MQAYLSHYGWHFSKAFCEWAVSLMRDRNDNPVQMRTKEQVEAVLKAHNVTIVNDKGYDKVFVFHMGLSDYMGDSVPDEPHLARYGRNVLDDKDGYDGIAFSRFLMDCMRKGMPILWSDMI